MEMKNRMSIQDAMTVALAEMDALSPKELRVELDRHKNGSLSLAIKDASEFLGEFMSYSKNKKYDIEIGPEIELSLFGDEIRLRVDNKINSQHSMSEPMTPVQLKNLIVKQIEALSVYQKYPATGNFQMAVDALNKEFGE